MVVQHNLTAMNSNRMLGITSSAQAKSTEKLSSGYKINRAADDAAGLSISEKMRKQIRGLTQASLNAEDGISAVQTAEGALTEVHDMLQRMNELAVKAANETNSVDDREYIQNEIDQLVTEIDRVAETTKFNETYLLKGDITAAKEFTAVYKTAEVEASVEVAENVSLYAAGGDAALSEEEIIDALENGDTLYKSADVAQTESTASYTAAKLNFGTGDVWAEVSGSRTKVSADNMATYFDVAADGTVSVKTGVTLYDADTSGNDVTNNQTTVTGEEEKWTGVTATLYAENGTEALSEDAAKAALKAGDTLYTNAKTAQTEAEDGVDYEFTAAAKPALYDVNGNKISENGLDAYLDIAEDGTVTLKANKELYTDDKAGNLLTNDDLATYVATEQTKVASLDLALHVGADATSNNQIEMEIESMSAAGIGVDNLKVDGKDDTNALNAIETIKAAIQKVSTQRSALGAIQNRLEHTIANLDNVVENTTAAESQIRDTDMATEMVKYSNNNILAQAGQSMLAQANQSNQGVLSLLG